MHKANCSKVHQPDKTEPAMGNLTWGFVSVTSRGEGFSTMSNCSQQGDLVRPFGSQANCFLHLFCKAYGFGEALSGVQSRAHFEVRRASRHLLRFGAQRKESLDHNLISISSFKPRKVLQEKGCLCKSVCTHSGRAHTEASSVPRLPGPLSVVIDTPG